MKKCEQYVCYTKQLGYALYGILLGSMIPLGFVYVIAFILLLIMVCRTIICASLLEKNIKNNKGHTPNVEASND